MVAIGLLLTFFAISMCIVIIDEILFGEERAKREVAYFLVWGKKKK